MVDTHVCLQTKKTRKRPLGTFASIAKHTHKQLNSVLYYTFRTIDALGFVLDNTRYRTVYSADRCPLFAQVHMKRATRYRIFRIPVIVRVNTSPRCYVLLAFAEAREGVLDTGSIDIVCRRSFNKGHTWDDGIVVVSHNQLKFSKRSQVDNEGDGTCGNSCVVVDKHRRQLVMVFCHNHKQHIEQSIRQGEGERSVWVTRCPFDCVTRRTNEPMASSANWYEHGAWSTPVDITASVKRKHWTWYASGPGVGLTIMHKSNKSTRLLIPCDHSTLHKKTGDIGHGVHLIYSDDGGDSWQLGACFDGGELAKHGIGLNECQVVEIQPKGQRRRLLLNCRSLDDEVVSSSASVAKHHPSYTLLATPASSRQYVRRIAHSFDDGLSFTLLHDLSQHSDVANCQVGFVPAIPQRAQASPLLWFSNPTSHQGRKCMTLRLVPCGHYEPDGQNKYKSRERSMVLRKGAAAYSSLVPLTASSVGVLFEAGTWIPGVSSNVIPAISYQAIVFRVVRQNELVIKSTT